MPEPCKQEGSIGSLTTAIEFLVDAQKRDAEIQKETLATLKLLAVQGEQIRSLIVRQDTTEKDVNEVYPRLRKVEEKAIRHDDFIKQHDKDEEKNESLATYVKGSVAVAGILALVAFLLFLYAHSGYSGRVEHAAAEAVGKKTKTPP